MAHGQKGSQQYQQDLKDSFTCTFQTSFQEASFEARPKFRRLLE